MNDRTKQHREALLKGTATRVMSVLDSAKDKEHWLVVKNQASKRASIKRAGGRAVKKLQEGRTVFNRV